MDWAALISWIVTAGGGFVLLGLWLRHGLLAVTTVVLVFLATVGI
jgi:hypothetical protein